MGWEQSWPKLTKLYVTKYSQFENSQNQAAQEGAWVQVSTAGGGAGGWSSWGKMSANCFEELFDLFLLHNKCINAWVLYVFYSIHPIVS